MAHDEARPKAALAGTFVPTIGDTTLGLGEWLVRKGTFSDLSSYEPVRRDALDIVKLCHPFNGPDGTKTGLVVGYVQSGKTVSMEAVSALASDSGCRVIILLAGVTTNLLKQNADRFKQDLREASGRSRHWKIFNSQDGFGEPEVQSLQQAVREWKEGGVSDEDQQSFLYLVLKNHAHLDRLQSLLKLADMRGIPALVLDDEADQAGLNTAVAKSEESTTYQRIARIRKALPHHTYLQYTATPQAPLLIALDDMLSPAFAELVEPGDGYTGGQAFFGEDSNPDIVKPIPPDDQFKPGTPPDEPPESLLEAMRVFFVGCAVASFRGRPVPRSMLVHPSPRKNDHRQYLTWVQQAIRRWTDSLASPDEQDRVDAIEEFLPAYEELSKTDAALPSFTDLVAKLQLSVRRVLLKEVNSEDGGEIDWKNAAEHILVGGEKLNRGFTVEGLTVTYMPRDAGDWNADTIQQRARFFGYKKGYLSLCRLYLHPDVIHAYRAYVRHEEDVRHQLLQHRGRPLREWRRAFFMDARMRPTRKNVLSVPYFRVETDKAWFTQEQPYLDPEAAGRNLSAIRSLMPTLDLSADDPYSEFGHKTCEITLRKFFDEILLTYEARGADLAAWYAQLVMLGDILETSPDAQMVLVAMRQPRDRTETDGRIKLHQGRSSSLLEGKYPGDAKMCDSTLVTVQIHELTLKGDAIQGTASAIALAVHIPKELRRDDVVAQG